MGFLDTFNRVVTGLLTGGISEIPAGDSRVGLVLPTQQITTDALTGGTAAIIDFEKGRINVPFSGAQVRAALAPTAGALTLEQFNIRQQSQKFAYSPFSLTVTPYVGAIGAIYTGSILSQAALPAGQSSNISTLGQVGQYSLRTSSSFLAAQGTGTIASGIISVFGDAGRAVVQLFYGDFAGFAKTIQRIIQGPTAGGGGGGGGPAFNNYSGQIQSGINPLLVLGGLGILVIGLYFYFRKR